MVEQARDEDSWCSWIIINALEMSPKIWKKDSKNERSEEEEGPSRLYDY